MRTTPNPNCHLLMWRRKRKSIVSNEQPKVCIFCQHVGGLGMQLSNHKNYRVPFARTSRLKEFIFSTHFKKIFNECICNYMYVCMSVYMLYFCMLLFPSVFDTVGWAAGRASGIRPVKNWAVGCWRGYLSGARCRLAYGPDDANATHCLLLQWNPDWFYLSGTGSPG